MKDRVVAPLLQNNLVGHGIYLNLLCSLLLNPRMYSGQQQEVKTNTWEIDKRTDFDKWLPLF